MGDRYPRVKGAAVQAAPAFLDREATVEGASAVPSGASGALSLEQSGRQAPSVGAK